jgi:hypothetical protein
MENNSIMKPIITYKSWRKRSSGRPLKRWHETVTGQMANT